MKNARTFIRSSLLALGLTVAATGAFADSSHRGIEPAPLGAVCQTCPPHNAVQFDQHRRVEPDLRTRMVPAATQPYRMAPAPAVAPFHQQIPGIVLLLGSL